MPGGLSFMMIVFWALFSQRATKKPRYYTDAHMVYNVNPEHMEKNPTQGPGPKVHPDLR